MAMVLTYRNLGPIRVIVGTWTSDGSGDAAATTTKTVYGEVVKAITDPGGAAPTADYDIVITDEQSFNILTNCEDDLADRHTSTTEEVYFLVPNLAATDPGGVVHPVVADKLTVTLSNAGDTKNGVVYIYVKGVIGTD